VNKYLRKLIAHVSYGLLGAFLIAPNVIPITGPHHGTYTERAIDMPSLEGFFFPVDKRDSIIPWDTCMHGAWNNRRYVAMIDP